MGLGDLYFDGHRRANLAKRGQAGTLITYERHVWRPDVPLAQNLPTGFRVAMARCGDPAGRRRWFLEELLTGTATLTAVIGQSFLGGLEILRQARRLTSEQAFSYRFMWLLFARRETFQEYYDRSFRYSCDLFIRLPGRDHLAGRNPPRTILSVLKPDLSISGLQKMGGELAQARGWRDLPRHKLIRLGLWKLASEDPLKLTADQVPGVVRRALFRSEVPDRDVEAVLEHVLVERFIAAIEEHQHLSETGFREWFCDAVSHGFKHLAAQKKARGGPLPPEQAKQVVLALLWRSHRYVGECFHAQMRVIQKCIRPRLTDDEATLFERMYLKQSVFADLPWLLISQRSDILAEELFEWLDDPARTIDAAIIHRLFGTYAGLVNERQKVDRRFKKPRAGRSAAYAFDESRDSPSRAKSASGGAGVDIVLDERIRCGRCGGTSLELVGHKETSAERITLELACQSRDCDEIVTHTMSVLRLRKLLESVRHST